MIRHNRPASVKQLPASTPRRAMLPRLGGCAGQDHSSTRSCGGAHASLAISTRTGAESNSRQDLQPRRTDARYQEGSGGSPLNSADRAPNSAPVAATGRPNEAHQWAGIGVVPAEVTRKSVMRSD